MRAMVQRVGSASVTSDAGERNAISGGLLVYLGVALGDSAEQARMLADKVRYLRIFEDEAGKLNRDVLDAGGAVLCVSAFTLMADARKGRRPAFIEAAAPEVANELYQEFCVALGDLGVEVQRGFFRQYMQVESINDGPICILLDTADRRR
jgi:D-tyrosyl-tRNA(Tyr) deacylase